MATQGGDRQTSRRVVLVGPGPGTRGGIAQFNAELAEKLREDGVEPQLLSYRRIYPSLSAAGRQGRDPSARQHNITSAPMLVPWFPWTWFRAGRTLRDAPEAVVIQWWHPILALSSWYIAGRGRAVGARVIFVCHNAWPHESFPAARLLSRLALQNGTRLVALSEAVATELRELVRGARVDVIPHPPYRILDRDSTNAEQRAGEWRSRIGVPSGVKVVLFFGNVRPYKGLRDLVDAFPRVAAETNAVLIVAGTFFEPVDGYRRRINELGLEGSVRLFADYIPNEDVPALFAASDLVVLPYRSASQSGVIPLAAMLQKPVVATSVGGIEEALDGHGILVPPNDPVALGKAIVGALAQPPLPPVIEPHIWERWREAVLAP